MICHEGFRRLGAEFAGIPWDMVQEGHTRQKLCTARR